MGSWNAAQRLILDIDASIVRSDSEKENAAPTWKRTFGFHPMLCYLDETSEALAGRLRPGNATANDAQDQLDVLDDALAQLLSTKAAEPILVRGDSASGTHAFVDGLRARGLRSSVGMEIHEGVRSAILELPEDAWVPAITQDAEEREGASIVELPPSVVKGLAAGIRAICRSEVPTPARCCASPTTPPGPPIPGVPDRPARGRRRLPGGTASRPCPHRGPHPVQQAVRADQLAVPRRRRQRDLAGAGARGSGLSRTQPPGPLAARNRPSAGAGGH